MTDRERNTNSLRRAVILLAATTAMVAIFWVGLKQIRQRVRLQQEQSKREWRQKSFDAVKAGGSTAYIMDSKLLPMLANDADCKQIVTNLDFGSTEIDAADANFVAMLKNVTSITFYCTTGTEHVLQAAKTLPITNLHFEMPDLTPESYLMLDVFPDLENVRFEHVMAPEWIDRLESKLPGVKIDAPFTH